MSISKLNRYGIALEPFYSEDKVVEKALSAEPIQPLPISEVVTAQSLQKIVQVSLHQELDKLIGKHTQNKDFEEVESILGSVQSPTQFLHDYATEPYYYIEPLLNLSANSKKWINAVVNPIEAAKTALQGVELMGGGAALIVQAVQLQEARHLLKTKELQLQQEPFNENLKNSIAQLQIYISTQAAALKEKVADFASLFCIVGLNTTSFILEAVNETRALINYPMGWSFYLLDVLTASISLWRAQKAKSTYEVWIAQMAKNPRTYTQAEMLLKKRQERMILQKAEKMSFENLKSALEVAGFDCVGKEISSWENFILKLDKDEIRNEIAQKFLSNEDEKEATINVMLRNSFQSLVHAKGMNEKKFFQTNFVHSMTYLALAGLSAVCAIALEALAIAGVIAIATSTIALPILGFFILSWIIWGAGLYFFYRHRPNLFKCFLKGIQLRLAFLQIPAKIRRLQLNRKTEQLKRLEQQGTKKIEKVLREEQRLKEKVEAWYGKNGTITHLENQIKAAGMKDFALTNRLVNTVKNERIDIPFILSEKMKEVHLEDETKKILREKMDIQLEEVSEMDQNILIDKLKTFFKMDEGEFFVFMQQKILQQRTLNSSF